MRMLVLVRGIRRLQPLLLQLVVRQEICIDLILFVQGFRHRIKRWLDLPLFGAQALYLCPQFSNLDFMILNPRFLCAFVSREDAL